MFFFKKESDEDRQKRELQEASVKELERGNLPLGAQHRLKAQAESGSRFFSSNLSAKEYFLAREAGYEVVGQVMGSCFMKVGWRNFFRGFWGTSGEIENISHANKMARELAVGRLKKEAELLGAHGVIGVKVQKGNFDWGQGLSEFTAVGTAIRIPGSKCVELSNHIPFTSTLSGQEFWQLYEAGYWPTSLVMGNCSYYAKGDRQTSSAQMGFFGSLRNQELSAYNAGFEQARRSARMRLWQDVALNGGDGAIDMDIEYELELVEYEQSNIRYIDMLCNFMAMGTALIKRPDGKKRIEHSPLFVIDLRAQASNKVEFEEPIANLVGSGNSADDDDDD